MLTQQILNLSRGVNTGYHRTYRHVARSQYLLHLRPPSPQEITYLKVYQNSLAKLSGSEAVNRKFLPVVLGYADLSKGLEAERPVLRPRKHPSSLSQYLTRALVSIVD